jgi:hypothetical protein
MNQNENTQVSQDDGTHKQVPYEDNKAVPYEDNKVSCNGCKVELHLDEDVEEEVVVVVGSQEQQEAIKVYSNYSKLKTHLWSQLLELILTNYIKTASSFDVITLGLGREGR